MNAHALQDLFDLVNETDVIDWTGQFCMGKMAGAFCHSFATCLAFEVAVDRTQSWVRETIGFGLAGLVDGLGEFNLTNGQLVLSSG